MRPIQLLKQQIGRYGFLLLSLFLMIGLKPFLEGLVGTAFLADSLLTAMLVSGIYALSNSIVFRSACVLFVIIICLKTAHHLFDRTSSLNLLQIVFSALFVAQMIVIIFSHLLTEQEVDSDMIMGSACAFILIGFFWAHVYYLLDIFHPHSFKGLEQLEDEFWDYIYYSFVTLTTVGYGDVVAVTNQARGLTILEAIIGQLYLAIMVARLVGLHAQNRNIT